MNTNNSISNLLQGIDPVTVVANSTLPNNPIITPLVYEDGNPKVDNNGNPLGSIRLEQNSRTLVKTFLNAHRRVAFIGGTMDVLQKIVEQAKLVHGSVIPGKIKIIESLEPMFISKNTGSQSPKINPSTGQMVGVTMGEKFYPVYMRMEYTDDVNAKDTMIRTPEDVITWLNARNLTVALQTLTPGMEDSRVPAIDETADIVGD